MRRNDRAPAKGGWVQKGVRGLAGGVGLVSESIKTRKESKVAKPEVQQDELIAEQGHLGLAGPSSGDAPNSRSEINSDRRTLVEKNGQSTDLDGDASRNLLEGTIEPEDSLENEWNLDDAQDELNRQDNIQDTLPTTPEGLEETFLQHNSLPPNTDPARRSNLQLPVVLPQRRPKDRSRGFIRAYAPVLENCGIDQAAWLEFLDTFQKSSAANPWISAINLASIATMFIPHGFGTLVSLAVQQATDLAMELQARGRTRTFLQKTNEEFFRPRGLYCLVMTWNPESDQRVEQVNLTATIESRSKTQTGLKNMQSKFKSADGKTYGNLEFPELAPLIFPTLDQIAAQTSANGVKEKNKMAKGMGFVGDYWDRRATADYLHKAARNPESALANVPEQKFKSRYADPNHPAASGSVIAFLSGGHLIPGPESTGLITGMASVVGQAVRGERQGASWERHREKQRLEDQERIKDQSNLYSRNYRGRDRTWEFGDSGIPIGPISTPLGVYKKLVQKNVLYLMVVNMPSDEEMAAAKATTRS